LDALRSQLEPLFLKRLESRHTAVRGTRFTVTIVQIHAGLSRLLPHTILRVIPEHA